MDFFISSYIGGKFSEEKAQTAINLILSIKKHFPNSRIILIDSVPNQRICELCDFYVCFKQVENYDYHGMYHLEKLKSMIKIGELLNTKRLISLCYDYIINEQVAQKIKEYNEEMDKEKIDLVSSSWRVDKNCSYFPSICTGFGIYNFEAFKIGRAHV